MSTEHVIWLCIFTSFPSVSKAATAMAHGKNEGGMKLSSNITNTEPPQLSRDIRSEVQDAVSYLPKRAVNVANSRERKDILLNSLTRKGDVLGEVSLSVDDNSEHEVKNNPSGSAVSTNSYDTQLQDNSFGLSTKNRVSLGHSADVGVITIRPHQVPNFYNDDEYFTGNEIEEGITEMEAAGEEEVTDYKQSLSMSEVDHKTFSEISERESYLVTYTTDSGAESTLLDAEIQDHEDITRSTTGTTVNNSMKAPNRVPQSEPDHAGQHSASKHTEKMLVESIKTSYKDSSTTGRVTNRINKLSSMETREGTDRTATSEVPAERYRTIKHTPRRGKESSRSPYQVENDYADDYYEVWRQTRSQSTTVSATEREEIKATDGKNNRVYVPYFPEHTFGTKTVNNSYSSVGVTNKAVDYYRTVSEESLKATTGTEKPQITQDVPHFSTGQGEQRTFYTQTVKSFYTSDEVTTAAYDHDSTVQETAARGTTNATKPLVSIQDSSTAENLRKTAKMQLFRVEEYNDVVNTDAAHRQLEGNYNTIATTASGSSAVSETPMSPYRTSRKYTKIKKLNCSTNGSECSATPQGLTPFKEYEESTKAVSSFENGSEFDFRGQRESLRKVFKVAEDFALCDDCDAEATDADDERGETRLFELPTKQKPASDNSDVPENYDTCVEENTEKTVLKNGTKLRPNLEGEDSDNQGANNKSKEGDKIVTKIMTDEMSHRKMPDFKGKSSPKETKRVGIIETSPSEYPWFVIIDTSIQGMRCSGAMVAPRWLVTAAPCVRPDDTRTDAYSAPVQLKVNVTGKLYRTVRAVFPAGGAVALVRLSEPPESALIATGRLEVADAAPPTLWLCCVALGLGRCEGDGNKTRNKTVKQPEHMFAVGAWALAGEGAVGPDTAPGRSSPLRTPCGAEPGAPIACHRGILETGGRPPPPTLTLEPPLNDPAELVLVGVSSGENRPGLGCRSSNYLGIATMHDWLEAAIARANADIERASGRLGELPPDPYSQRLRRLRLEGSLPAPLSSRGLRLRLLPLLATAAVSRGLLGS